jgi:hypothetical protein
MNDFYTCLHCGKMISRGVHEFSKNVYGVPLCLRDQVLLIESQVSQEAKDLYLALRYNQIPAELEYRVGEKTIDVAIPGRLYIEVDLWEEKESGSTSGQWPPMSFSSTPERIPTIKIPHSLVNSPNQFRKTVDGLTQMYGNLGKVG